VDVIGVSVCVVDSMIPIPEAVDDMDRFIHDSLAVRENEDSQIRGLIDLPLLVHLD